jgi:hypothetical protein
MSETDAAPQTPPEEPQLEQPPEPLPTRPDPELMKVVQESDDSDPDNIVWG